MIGVPSKLNLEFLLSLVLHRSILIEDEVYDNLRDLDGRLDTLEASNAELNVSVSNGQLLIRNQVPVQNNEEQEETNNG